MHLDAHVVAQVSESSQYVVDKFCLVSGLIVAKKVLYYQNKCLPRFQFHFVHWVFELWISDELLDLKTVKHVSFQLLRGQSWKSLVVKQSSSLSRALVNYLIKPSLMCSGGKSILSVHQRVIDDVPFFARHQFLPQKPVLLRVMLNTVPTIPHAQKTWVLGESRLLSQQKVHL